MIRSEKDFLDNLLGAIHVGRQLKADGAYVLEKVEEMVKNRLLIFSGKDEPNWDIRATFCEPPKTFTPILMKGKPLSEMVIEDRG